MYESVEKSIHDAYAAFYRTIEGNGGKPDTNAAIARFAEYARIINAVEKRVETAALIQLLYGVPDLLEKDRKNQFYTAQANCQNYAFTHFWKIYNPKRFPKQKTYGQICHLFVFYAWPKFIAEKTNGQKPSLSVVCQKCDVPVNKIYDRETPWPARLDAMETALRQVLAEGMEEPRAVVKELHQAYLAEAENEEGHY